MLRTIELSLETAINFYKKGGEFRELALSAFTRYELMNGLLPKSWEEWFSFLPEPAQNVYIELFKRMPSKYVALMKLELLRDCYRKSEDRKETGNYCINRCAGGYAIDTIRIVALDPSCYQHFLSFRTYKTAQAFRKNFDKLLKEAGDLI